MSIVSSVITRRDYQPGGRSYVYERHVDHLGVAHECFYLADATADVDAILAARAAALPGQLAESEIQKNLNLESVTFQHCTIAEFRSALRERFREAKREEAIRIANWINLNLTDAQLRTVFDLTVAQATALRTKLQNATTLYNNIQAAAGE